MKKLVIFSLVFIGLFCLTLPKSYAIDLTDHPLDYPIPNLGFLSLQEVFGNIDNDTIFEVLNDLSLNDIFVDGFVNVTKVTNGNFSDGTTGWSTDAGNTRSIENGYMKVVDNGADAWTSIAAMGVYGITTITNHVYYSSADVYTDNLNTYRNYFNDNDGSKYFFNGYVAPTSWTTLSNLATSTNGKLQSTLVYTFYTTPFEIGTAYFDNIMVFDLTEIFGTGNEPTLINTELLYTFYIDNIYNYEVFELLYDLDLTQVQWNYYHLLYEYYTDLL